MDAALREAYGPSGAPAPDAGTLPLVSQAMAATWRLRRGTGLTLRGYRRAGGLANAVDRGARRVYQELDEGGQATVRTMFLLLTRVTADGRVVRRTAARTELYAAAAVSRRDGDAVIGAFAAERLLVLEGENVSICHDVLLDAWRELHEWLQGDAADQALYGELLADADTWHAHQRPRDDRPRQLAAITAALPRWQGSPGRYPPLPGAAAQFVTASQRAARRAHRLRQAVSGVLLILTLLAGATAVTAQRNAQQERTQHAIALSRQLAADSVAAAGRDPALAGQFAVTAWAAYPTTEAGLAMMALLTSNRRQGRTVVPAASSVQLPININSVAFSPDGKVLAIGRSDGTIRLWNPATRQPIGAPIQNSLTNAGYTLSVAFNPESEMLAAGGGDGTIRLWNPATRQPIGAPIRDDTSADVTDNGGVYTVAFSPDGTMLAAGGGDGTIRLWNPANGQPIGAPIRDDAPTDATDNGAVTSVVFSPDGTMLAAGGGDGTIRLWNPAARQPIGAPIADETAADAANNLGITSIAFSPDGKTLAAGGSDGTIRLWNPATRQPIGAPIRDVAEDVSSVAFSPDGKVLAAGADDGTIRLWNPANGQPIGAPIRDETAADAANNLGITSIAFSPDGTMLAAGGSDGTIRLWNPVTRQPIGAPIRDNADSPTSVAFSPDGKVLAAGGGDGTIRLWNPATRQGLGIPIQDTPAPSAWNTLLPAAFSADGTMLAAGAVDGTVELRPTVLLTNPYQALCNEVGPLGAADWDTYASGETEPSACGNTP